MPSIHPSEKPPLGWLVPCLSVSDLEASLDFYAKLDLVPYGGDAAEGWAMLRNRAVEIHLFDERHIPADLLNFRGGDPGEIRAALHARGLVIDSEQGPRSFIYRDPDRREVFFDTSPEEESAYRAGMVLTGSVPAADVHRGDGIDLGNLTLSLACGNLAATMKFYTTLGMVEAGGDPASGWAILSRADHMPKSGKRLMAASLSLFSGMIPADMLNFRGGDVGATARIIEDRGVDLMDGVKTGADGGESLYVEDPDGRPVYFDTTPPERLDPPPGG